MALCLKGDLLLLLLLLEIRLLVLSSSALHSAAALHLPKDSQTYLLALLHKQPAASLNCDPKDI